MSSLQGTSTGRALVRIARPIRFSTVFARCRPLREIMCKALVILYEPPCRLIVLLHSIMHLNNHSPKLSGLPSKSESCARTIAGRMTPSAYLNTPGHPSTTTHPERTQAPRDRGHVEQPRPRLRSTGNLRHEPQFGLREFAQDDRARPTIHTEHVLFFSRSKAISIVGAERSLLNIPVVKSSISAMTGRRRRVTGERPL